MSQSRAPEEVIVVDSSDEPSQNIALIEQISKTNGIPVRFISSKASMTYQRNIGLESVRSDVVLFPDDDSLLYPDTMTDVMDIYDRDESDLIGGVGAGEALTPPPGVLENSQTTYTKKPTDRLKAARNAEEQDASRHYMGGMMPVELIQRRRTEQRFFDTGDCGHNVENISPWISRRAGPCGHPVRQWFQVFVGEGRPRRKERRWAIRTVLTRKWQVIDELQKTTAILNNRLCSLLKRLCA
jgi:glycosyltransferase involved in cell wall biosynthesis